VWRFVTPDESDEFNVDESYVLAQTTAPGAGEFGSYLVAAHVELQAGAVLPGVVQVDILDAQFVFTPVTVFAAGKSVDPLGQDAQTRLQRILKTPGAQPFRWRLDVTLIGESKPRSAPIANPGLGQALDLLAQLLRLKHSRRAR
jgi:hypothetical protein